MIRRQEKIIMWALAAVIIAVAAFLYCPPAAAQSTPASAAKYRPSLTRIAHAEWGLDAPIPAFAAQLQQESGWNPLAVSRVGAKGMAQFMPDTAKWWCEKTGQSAADCAPTNPVWAMRSMVGYDRWLFARVSGDTEFDRLWAALRAYNGGLGHWQAEAATVRPVKGRESIDAACGKAKRHISFCRENLGYPQRILILLQPRYAGWGREVTP